MATFVENRKARFDFEIIEVFEAGIELTGAEVKSIRSGRGDLRGSYVIIRGGQAYLQGMHIPPYQVNNTPSTYNSRRTRRLLLHTKELWKLSLTSETKGLTIIPLSLYNNSSKIKVEVAVVRGKKKFDKRASVKKREAEREMRRSAKLG